MRILHTSDWHLGRSLHGLDLLAYQREFCNAIVGIAESSEIDCVLIAGDIFDKALAPVDAIRLFSDTLDRLGELCVVIVTSGNHDSAVRLGAGARLFRDGIHIVTEPEQVGPGIDLVVDNTRARIYPVPYLDPDHARHVLSETDEPLARSHEAVMEAAVGRIDAFDTQLPEVPDCRIVVAHAFVTGGERTESERDIAVGGVDSVPSAIFAGFDYVALGHLHGPQQVAAGDPLIRYCGSPLRYSFSEGRQAKSVTVINVDDSGIGEVELIEIPQPRKMVTLKGSMSEALDPANVNEHRESWVRVIATDSARPPQLLELVRNSYPHALSVVHQPEQAHNESRSLDTSVDLRDPVTVSRNFIKYVTTSSATQNEVAVLRNAYEVARDREAD